MSFRFLTAGESHGKALVGILEGLPSGVSISIEKIQAQMQRRKLGYGRGARQKIETDEVEIVSGIRFGKTIGSPIALLIQNKDWTAWKDIMQSEERREGDPVRRKVDVPRPGHADYVGGLKYRHSDMRNVLERSSARETAMRVALGCVARQFLEALGIQIASRVTQIGKIESKADCLEKISELNAKTDFSPVRCTDKEAESEMIAQIEAAKKEGNTLGGVFEVLAEGVPIGLGSYSQWDRRLEAEIGRSFLSLNAVKGVEIGAGFRLGGLTGSEAHDEYFPSSRSCRVTSKTNRSGGIDGGMSTGKILVVRAAMKPLATLMEPLRSVNLETGEATHAHVERSDVCAVPAAAVIGESLLALNLSQFILEKFGGDSIEETLPRLVAWNQETCDA